MIDFNAGLVCEVQAVVGDTFDRQVIKTWEVLLVPKPRDDHSCRRLAKDVSRKQQRRNPPKLARCGGCHREVLKDLFSQTDDCLRVPLPERLRLLECHVREGFHLLKFAQSGVDNVIDDLLDVSCAHRVFTELSL